MTNESNPDTFVQRLVTVKSNEDGNQNVLLLRPEGVSAEDAAVLVDKATRDVNEVTDNGHSYDFWTYWTKRLAADGFTVIGEVNSVTALNSIPWDEDTYKRPAYIVHLSWGHGFSGDNSSRTRFVMEPSEDGPTLLSAQVEHSDGGWSDLDQHASADLLSSLIMNQVDISPKVHGGIETDQLPEWVSLTSEIVQRRQSQRG